MGHCTCISECRNNRSTNNSILEEADQLADRIAVINQGKIIAEGTSDELKAPVGSGTLQIRLSDTSQKELAIHLLEEVLGTHVHTGTDAAALTSQVAHSSCCDKSFK